MDNTGLTESVDLGARFDQLRDTLLTDQYSDRLEKPLEYWALPSDRRLPLALLDRTVGDLLSTSFKELSATPGIGEKKIQSLVKLLNRATQEGPPSASEADLDAAVGTANTSVTAQDPILPRFDPSIVSEALWAEWRQAVRIAGVGSEKLGNLAPSLQRLPTVIWHTPLSHYLDHTVAEIRRLKTHGEKRVRCVLEVFHSVYYKLKQAEARFGAPVVGEAAVQLLTADSVKQLRSWVAQKVASEQFPDAAEIQSCFVEPAMELIRVDCGDTVHRLVEERLGIGTTARSVRDQARTLGVTRARVYQLLDDCGKVMAVRWPMGGASLDRLVSHFGRFDAPEETLRSLFGLRELCFPTKESERLPAETVSSEIESAKSHSTSEQASSEQASSQPASTAFRIAPDTSRADLTSSVDGREPSRLRKVEDVSAGVSEKRSQVSDTELN